ncbi:echinoderm microtubule-associated protein-like 2 isoform X2 [Clavelina lepadiformis]|uniref:echinoderm microtubule-associated protein-like 2 isoform X2 n=1 Tax=Clavelina lepadiformis TaxID=159417 RepID=UPI004042DA9A
MDDQCENINAGQLEGITDGRVRALEQRVELQEEEIAVLKSSLADVLRRLKEVEGNPPHIVRKPSPIKNAFQPLPSRPVMDHGGSSKMRVRPPSPSLKNRITSAKDTSRLNGRGDVRASTENFQRDAKRSSTRTRRLSSQKPATYNEQDGVVKMHLRGRPLILYRPTELESAYNIKAPSQLPENSLKLEWVYGYRGKDCRSNVYFLPTGEIVYFVAAVVVLYDPKDGYQRHYLGHNDDVKCLAMHPDKLKIATGQVAGHDLDGTVPKGPSSKKLRVPCVRIWDAVSLTTLHVIESFERAVASISFSKADGGALLCAIDESNDHVLTVWNWQKQTKIAEAKSSKDQVLVCEFNSHIDGSIVSCGKSHINFWSLESGQLVKKQGLFERHDKPKYILCLAFTNTGETLSGDSNGNIEVWSKGVATRKISHFIAGAHEGPIFSICATRDSFISGGKDGQLKRWNESFKLAQQTSIPENAGSVRTISYNDQGNMLVGTKGNRILYGSFDQDFDTLVHGHTEELWGLAIHPVEAQFLTGAYDKQLILWDTATHAPLWIKNFNDAVQSADFHPTNAQIIAVGMATGRWVVIDSDSLELVTVHTDGSEQHDVIRFSPDGNYLAIGSHDNFIYIYNVSEDGRKYSKHGRCSGHSSFITHFDWSKDSKYLQSNSGDYELLYWDVETSKQITAAASLRDVEWHTQSCTLGFSVLGIWPEGADGTDINSVGRSNDNKLLASGDDFGKVNLFRYPAAQLQGASHSYSGHSSHVTSVQFLNDDKKLLSVGGQDCSAMQWAVV